MSIYEDIAAIVHPMPALPDASDDLYNEVRHQVHASREELAFKLEAASDSDPEQFEPLLSAIDSARRRKEWAEVEIRRLVAYGREFTRPRPYKLADLAGASGMSISGVRTAYGLHDVADVEEATGRKPREWRAPADDDPPATGNEQ